MKEEILIWFENASPEDREIGMDWYHKANRFAKKLSRQYHLPLKTVAGILSALSPSVGWELNKKQAEDLIKYGRDVRVSTYNMNKEKALRILSGSDPLKEFIRTNSTFKTYNFYMNILDPGNPLYVTIDRQILKAFNMEHSDINTRRKYTKIKSQFLYAANQLGIVANQLQAIIWLAHKSHLKGKLINEVGF